LLHNGAATELQKLATARARRQQRGVSASDSPVHLVLPDPIERAACFRALATRNRIVRSFASADDWLTAVADDDHHSMILLCQWRQPGRTTAAELLAHAAKREHVCILVAADTLEVGEAATILRSGVCDLLPAPLDPRRVRARVEAALDAWRRQRFVLDQRREAEARLAALTPRERSILDAIAAGLGNKAIARQLDLSPRTVEVHRAKIMRRAGADSVAELLRWQFIAEQARGAAVNPVHFGA
jgi:two-component system response regulator FixJ